MRNAARTDANQRVIVDALHKLGCQTIYIKWPTDLIVSGGTSLGDFNLLMEVKMPGESLNAGQKEFWMRWPGRKVVVHTVSEALEAVLGKDMLA
jgi:hypothetical protein